MERAARHVPGPGSGAGSRVREGDSQAPLLARWGVSSCSHGVLAMCMSPDRSHSEVLGVRASTWTRGAQFSP